jgi:hypothetical protein
MPRPAALTRNEISHRLELSYKSWPPSFTRGCTAPPSRHYRRLWCHGEPRAPAAFTAKSCHSYLPLAPTKLPHSLVGQIEPPVRQSRASSGHCHRLPPCPPSGPLPTASEYANRALANPGPSPAASSAKTAGELAGIRPTAPPPCLKGYIVRLQVILGCFVQN